ALLRGATYLHGHYELSPMLSIIGGMLISGVVLLLYITLIYERLTDRLGGVRAFKNRSFFVLIILLGFCAHGLFFISSANLKDPSLSQEIRDMHPILRLSISTIILLDKDLIVTDASRVAHDYKQMNLPTPKSSLHYKQKDGYAYAVDLRTTGRSELRNILLRGYFRIIGLRTIRHVGTADHLHVSLLLPERPYAK
ncbi:MAG: hypothetical protein AAFR14_11275, partial [Bacteroidota bacterium]